MELKATAVLDHKLTDENGEALPHPLTSLTVSGELLPMVPIQHHILAALLDPKNPPEVKVKYGNNNGVLSFTLTFSHEDDVVAAGKAAFDAAEAEANKV